LSNYPIYVTRRIPGTAIARLQEIGTVDVFPGPGAPTRKILLREVRNRVALLTMLSDKITPEVIDAAGPNLCVISNYAVGFDNIDIAYATKKAIIVAHTPDVLTDSTADLAWALLMATARRLTEADQLTRSGGWKTWEPTFMLGTDVHHKTLGLIGLGRIGLSVARRALSFNMRVIYYSRTRKPEIESALHVEYHSLDELLRQSDFVSIHVPLTPETRDMIGEAQLKLMKPSAILVNTARGPIINEHALVHALKNSYIRAAGLDVYREEPTRNYALLQLPNVVLSPHLGSATIETRNKMADLAATNIINALSQNYDSVKIVNPTVLKSLK
jgi:glyoxylate reductase